MHLPPSSFVDVPLLGQVFNNTSATYKYYWFLSILDLHTRTSRVEFSFSEIISCMIASAWYPVHYFKLSFGPADNLAQRCQELHQLHHLRIDADKSDIQAEVLTFFSKQTPKIHQHLLNLSTYVPYRFLSPWFPKTTDAEVTLRSQRYENNCPYAIHTSPERKIILNPNWLMYLKDNAGILHAFCYWNLTLFLQVRNPNVPDIPNKLIKPPMRGSLTGQRNYWKIAFGKLQHIPCIYTGRDLTADNFALDHFIPWSFVAHDQLWNLLPADASVNSSKGNRLPSLEIYLREFAHLQHQAIKIVAAQRPNWNQLEDFLQLGAPLSDLISMPENSFLEIYRRSLSPLIQIAENMGFQQWTA